MLEPSKFYSPEVQAAAAKIWMPTERDWDRVAKRLDAANDAGEYAGLDSEFYGLDIRKQSCAYRAKIHVFSVAWLTSNVSPRGFRRARGAVLPREAMFYGPIRRWLTSSAWKVASNSPVDAHAFENELGESIGGLENSLSFYRWMEPGRRQYGLDIATMDLLGRKPFCTYTELTTEEYQHTRFTQRKIRVCECGAPGCRKRDPINHERREAYVETPKVSTKERTIPLETIVPGHPRHSALVLYAADDAIASVEEKDILMLRDKTIPYPWFK